MVVVRSHDISLRIVSAKCDVRQWRAYREGASILDSLSVNACITRVTIHRNNYSNVIFEVFIS